MSEGVYVGVPHTIPPSYESVTVDITSANISELFTVQNNSYYFAGNGSVFTSNNASRANSEAVTTLTAKYACTVTYDYSVSSETNDKLTIKEKNTTVVNGLSGTQSGSRSVSLNAGDTISFSYKKNGYTNRNNDNATFSNMKVSYEVVGEETTVEVAREVEEIDIGVDNITRFVEKGYVGIGGVARVFWSVEGFEYYGAITPLDVGRYYMASGSLKDYAVFVGGGYSDGEKEVQYYGGEAYTAALTKVSTPVLEGGINKGGVVGTGDYLIFPGSYNGNAQVKSGFIALDNGLTSFVPKAFLLPYIYPVGASVGEFGLLMAYYPDSSNPLGIVFSISSDLTYNYFQSAVVDYVRMGASTKNHALFAGGYMGTTTMEAYDADLVCINAPEIGAARLMGTGGSISGCAVFAGGFSTLGFETMVEVYDENLTKFRIDDISAETHEMLSASTENHLVFCAGGNVNMDYGYLETGSKMVYVYDKELTKCDDMTTGFERFYPSCASVGNYILIGGGGVVLGNETYYDRSVEAFKSL